MMKQCSKCRIEKSIKDFSKQRKYLRSHCKNCISIHSKKYRLDNKEKLKQYNLDNKDKFNSYKRLKYHERKNDIQYILSKRLRSRLYDALKGNFKTGSAMSDLGCSIDFLKEYLESKFQDGMTWPNYGLWHIDHVRPLSSFDLTDRNQLLEACNYTNLQPLWAEDNIKKGNKVCVSGP